VRRLTLAALAAVLALPALALAAGEPDYQPVPADVQRARSSLIRKSDLLAVFRRDPKMYAGMPIPQCRGSYMPDRSDLIITGHAFSFFTNGADGIGSDVALFQSARQSRAWWSRVVRPQYITCVARLFARHHASGVRTEVLFAKSLGIARGIAQRAARYRFAVSYTKGKQALVVYREVVFVSWGRATGTVMIAGVNRPCTCGIGLGRRLTGRVHAAVGD
jgi:hypothetical protein